MRGYFVTNKEDYFNSSMFSKVLSYVQSNPRMCKLQEQTGKPILIIESVGQVETAISLLHHMMKV